MNHSRTKVRSGSWLKPTLANGSCPVPEAIATGIGLYKKYMLFYFVYVLLSEKDGKFYIGSIANVEQRVAEHNTGKNISTANRRPLKLIFYEAFPTKTDALRREHYFKTTKGKVTIRQMIRDYLND
jgi:putative endonuclease